MKKVLHLLLALASLQVVAQPSIKKLAALQQQDRFTLHISDTLQAGILFEPGAGIEAPRVAAWLTAGLGLRPGTDELQPEQKPTITADNLEVSKWNQYFKGIKLEHGVITSTAKAGLATMLNMEFYAVPDDFNTSPRLTESQALAAAMRFANAKTYVWQDSVGGNIESMLPHGELVIVRNYTSDAGICLAWKLEVFATDPMRKTCIYADAETGKVVLADDIIKHSNVTAVGDTRFNGRQPFTTSNGSGVTGKPYQLKQTRNGHEIEIRDIRLLRAIPNTPTYTFADNDNDWTAAEWNNAAKDDAALDAMFNMEVVSDYWKNIHNRSGWDNSNGKATLYVHGVLQDGVPMDNALWNGASLEMGDGTGGTSHPRTNIDPCSHELGHGICQATARLVYRWESGAINESFGDIWAACITNYLKLHYPAVPNNKITWRYGDESTNPGTSNPGIRNMAKPSDFSNPDTYNDVAHFYEPATYATCPIQNNNNDHCGVHNNSGVFNKWFYLITEGETGTNSKGTTYSITGLGFGITQKIAYLSLLNLPPNASFSTARMVTTNAAATLYGENSDTLKTIKAAWVAVGVDSNVYDMSNTPVFATNNFTSISSSKNGYVWAGTSYGGLYMYNGSTWSRRAELPNVRINHIRADTMGGIWIAQSGTQANASQALAGGINYFPSPTAPMLFFTNSTTAQVPGRNARAVYIDTFRNNDGSNPRVWGAFASYIRTADLVSQSGMLGSGYYTAYKQFVPISDSINVASGTTGCQTVGGNKTGVWTFVQANFGKNQLLQYDAVTAECKATFDATKTPGIPANFVVRSIYFDARGRGWFGLANGGVLVRDEYNGWTQINFPGVFPPGTACSFNAITGDQYGDVYIGTTSGLVHFNQGLGEYYHINDINSYKLFGKANGLPSNNINAVEYDNRRYKLLVATDAGIVFWEPVCYSPACRGYPNAKYYEASTTKNGNWSDPTIWSDNKLPDSLTIVRMGHQVIVDVNASCRALLVLQSGSVRANPGIRLTIYDTSNDEIQSSTEKGRRRRRQ